MTGHVEECRHWATGVRRPDCEGCQSEVDESERSKELGRERHAIEHTGHGLLMAFCPGCSTVWVNVGGEGIVHPCAEFHGDHKVFVKRYLAKVVDLHPSKAKLDG